jgi:hypothetical protein
MPFKCVPDRYNGFYVALRLNHYQPIIIAWSYQSSRFYEPHSTIGPSMAVGSLSGGPPNQGRPVCRPGSALERAASDNGSDFR